MVERDVRGQPIPDLERIVHQKEVRLARIREFMPSYIAFANVTVRVPRYIKEGCERFIS